MSSRNLKRDDFYSEFGHSYIIMNILKLCFIYITYSQKISYCERITKYSSSINIWPSVSSFIHDVCRGGLPLMKSRSVFIQSGGG